MLYPIRRSEAKALPSGTPTKEADDKGSLDFGEDEIQEGEITEAPPAKPASNKTPAKRSYTTPKAVEIDATKAKMSLPDYCKTKNTSDTMKKYMVCAVWLKDFMGISTFTAGHIYTCFRLMSWGVQKDFSQTLRTAKKQDYLKSGSATASYELTHIGEDAVRKLGNP